MQLTKQQLSSLKLFFTDKPVKKVYLFGSYARGEADENSDVDLYVELDAAKIETAWEFFDMWENVQQLLNKKVDFASKLSKYIQPKVDAEKILIYERE
ncbi:MAG: nucleotidyltransferase domain-containing protein [Lewinellaceae bacterium]|nr:nucleotidyltransferase domain-containing protein [Lewinella sp.]MCB9280501.1 nucleotidyltransferase domain-containing protein [Lewinellaceae bacterium]